MGQNISLGSFVWDREKEKLNILKHDLDFVTASKAFFDPQRIIAVDRAHSREEERLFCIGKIQEKIATVRFTYRAGKIRIIGAGFWRKGEKLYEEEHQRKSQ
jgi:uncharacterized DUF497 family protein